MSQPEYAAWDGPKLEFGSVEAVPMGHRQFLLSTWRQRCIAVDIDHRTYDYQPLARPSTMVQGAGMCLSSPSTSREPPFLCAVATRASWASYWRLNEPATQTIFAENAGPVNAVAVSPEAAAIALGLGNYPLAAGRISRAAVELHAPGDPSSLGVRVLPGAVVDRLHWTSDSLSILAFCGDADQQHGHLARLDAASLDILDVTGVASAMAVRLSADPANDRVILVLDRGVEVRRLSDLGSIVAQWELPPPNSQSRVIQAAAISPDFRIVIKNGYCLDAVTGAQWQPAGLDPCVCAAILPEGGLIGFTAQSTLRQWPPAAWRP